MKVLKKQKGIILLVVAGILIVGITAVIFAKSMEDDMEKTRGVKVVTTLIEQVKKDTCWCGTFQLVWNDLKNEVVKKDVVFNPQVEMADNLNKETFTQKMLSEDYYYKTYGVPTFELKKKIEKDIKRKFNQKSDILDDFEWSEKGGDEYFFYSMLYRKFEFVKEFDKLKNGAFGSDSKKAKYFGIKDSTDEEVGEQIEVLFYNSKDDFAILINTKNNDEVIFYKNPKGKTFMDIYNNMNKQAKTYSGNRSFERRDMFKAPCLQVNATSDYKEIENKEFITNNKQMPKMKISKAVQTVKFVLNEKGGEVKSEAAISAKMSMRPVEDKPRQFFVDDTFTLFLREKGKDMPYFAMNVDDISKYQ